MALLSKKRQELLCKKGFLKNFAKFIGETTAPDSLLNKTLLKKRLWHRCYPVNFVRTSTVTASDNVDLGNRKKK